MPFIPSTLRITHGIDSASYRSLGNRNKGALDYTMTQSELKRFIETCPAKWLELPPREETNALKFGNLCDALFLTPDKFNDLIAIRPSNYTNDKGETKPWNANSKTCRQWMLKNAGKTQVSESEHHEACDAIARMIQDPHIANIDNTSPKQVVIQCDYFDKETNLTIPFKGAIDLLPAGDSEFIWDFKTTDDAQPSQWRRTVFNFGYHIQAAVYLDMLATAQPQRGRFGHIILESSHPFISTWRELSPEFIEMGREAYKLALSQYAQCLSSGTWGVWETDKLSRIVEPEVWMMKY